MVLNPKILFARRNFPILTLKLAPKKMAAKSSHFCHFTGLLHMIKVKILNDCDAGCSIYYIIKVGYSLVCPPS